MRLSRWSDHLGPWLAWSGLLATQVFQGTELTVMATPLVLAALVEALRLDLARFDRWLQALALVFALGLFLMGASLVPGVAQLMFMLCGLRLVLPRDLGRRRQLLLMSFVLFLLSASATLDITLALWLLAWLVLGSAMLLQQAWEPSAALRRGLPPRAPFKVLVPALAGTLVAGAFFFLLMPRLAVQVRPPWWTRMGAGFTRAGLSDEVNLAQEGPIAPNRDVVMRLLPEGVPPEEQEALQGRLALLRGPVLERYEEGVWKTRPEQIPSTRILSASRTWGVTVFLSPGSLSAVPLPYHWTLRPADPMPLLPEAGESWRWSLARRAVSLRLQVPRDRGFTQRAFLDDDDRTRLTQVGPLAEPLRAWSLRRAPEGTPPPQLVQRLSARLQQFAYTTTNPSAGAEDPILDFLTRTQAGHCEYFASSLALMLRTRGVPARVVNGYRLGPWVTEGHYFLVTQNEAHSWVEWYDESRQRWEAADPTPAAPSSDWMGSGLAARLQRSLDALSFRWDRYVLRFSDQDQLSLMDWAETRSQNLRLPPALAAHPGLTRAGAALLFLALAAWRFRHARRFRQLFRLPVRQRGHLPELTPLVRHLPEVAAPNPSETVRKWLLRLARLRPDRTEALQALTEASEAVAYGQGDRPALRHRVTEEVRAWKGWKPGRKA